MTTTGIIIAVFACLFVLVAVTFTLQQIEKNNREKSALAAALKTQTRNFQHLLDGFPDGFLSRDLRLLVCHCLSEGIDQLVRLERKNPQHLQAQRQLAERIAQLQTLPATPSQPQALTDAMQIQEVQKLLNSLFNVIQRLHQSGRLNTAQAENYAQQVQRLTTRVALDAHIASGQQALAEGKPRLAVHHFGLALDRMQKDNADGVFSAQIAAYQQRIRDLDTLAHNQQPAAVAQTAEWKNFDQKKEDTQKKKNIYD